MENVIIILSLLTLAVTRKNKGIGYARHRTFGGNSGYDGYSMSIRAREARADGKYPKTDFKRVYGLSETMFKYLYQCEIIMSYEWHHTSSWGNRTKFYEWDGEDFYEKYKANERELKNLIKEESDCERIMCEIELDYNIRWQNGEFNEFNYMTGIYEPQKPYRERVKQIRERVWEIFGV